MKKFIVFILTLAFLFMFSIGAYAGYLIITKKATIEEVPVIITEMFNKQKEALLKKTSDTKVQKEIVKENKIQTAKKERVDQVTLDEVYKELNTEYQGRPFVANKISQVLSKSMGEEIGRPTIESTFGFSLGDRFDPNSALRQIKSTHTTLYEVSPKSPCRDLTEYYVTVDEQNRINSVRGVQHFKVREEALAEMDIYIQEIGAEYNAINTEEHYAYFKDRKSNLIIIFIKDYPTHYDLHIQVKKL